MIFVSGLAIGYMLNGARTGDSGVGSGLKVLFEQGQGDDLQDDEIAELIEKKSSAKEFDFYELLPDIEKVMPDDLPDAEPNRDHQNYDYFLQAASFRSHADAEKLRARLALKGFVSLTQAREVKDKGVYYRVRLGPYDDGRKAKTEKNKLQKLGVRPFVYSVRKE